MPFEITEKSVEINYEQLLKDALQSEGSSTSHHEDTKIIFKSSNEYWKPIVNIFDGKYDEVSCGKRSGHGQKYQEQALILNTFGSIEASMMALKISLALTQSPTF